MLKNSKKLKEKSPRNDGFFEDLEDIENHKTFVIYGPPGTGKTTFAGTFPGPICYVDIRDQGTGVLKGVKNVKVKRLEDLDDLEEVLFRLQKNKDGFKTVVLDTVSQLQQMMVEEHLAGKKLKKGKRPGDWGTMSMQDWGAVTGEMKKKIIDFRDLADDGMNVVFLAQQKISREEAEEKEGSGYVLATTVGPSVSTSVAEVLNGSVAVVASTFNRVKRIKKEVDGKKKTITKIEFCLRLGANPVYVSKVRKPLEVEVPPLLVNPTYEDLIEIMNGE